MYKSIIEHYSSRGEIFFSFLLPTTLEEHIFQQKDGKQKNVLLFDHFNLAFDEQEKFLHYLVEKFTFKCNRFSILTKTFVQSSFSRDSPALGPRNSIKIINNFKEIKKVLLLLLKGV